METSLRSLGEAVKAAQRKLERLESLVNASPIVMFTCKAGGDFATTFVTEGIKTLSGYEPEELLGDPRFWIDRVHPEDRAAALDHLARVLQGGVERYEYRFRTSTGEYRWRRDEIRLVRDAAGQEVEIAGYCFDITEQKLADIALKESEARLNLIFNSTSELQALLRAEPNGTFATEAVKRVLKAEFARQESEERYALVTEAIHEGIFDWNLVTGDAYISPRYKEMLGFRDDEMGNGEEHFFGRIHPEDRARMLENKERYTLEAGRDRFEDELRLQHRDGSYRRVVSRGRILRNEQGAPTRIIGAVGDVTERLEAAAQLAASEKRLRDIIESLVGFLGLFTLDGTLIECNRASLEAAGARPEDWLGRPFWENTSWGSEDDRARIREMMRCAGQGEVVRFEVSLQLPCGPMLIDVTFRPLRDHEGKISNIIGHGVDVTSRKRAEGDLVRAKEAAEAASRAKSEFLANMSHEIRTPMNGIIGLTEVLLDTPLNEEQREYLTLVQSSAQSLLTIINDILDVSKIEAGKLSLEVRDFDLNQLVLDTLRTLKVSADAKGLRLLHSIAPSVPSRVLGDAGRVRQVLMNLVGNAIKFTESGEISIAIDQLSGIGHTLHFTVRDTGIGIPADKQALIFEAFIQADGSFTRRFGGTGLGLTIATRLVHMMNGRIWVESAEGRGSTFHFTAHLAPVPAETPAV